MSTDATMSDIQHDQLSAFSEESTTASGTVSTLTDQTTTTSVDETEKKRQRRQKVTPRTNKGMSKTPTSKTTPTPVTATREEWIVLSVRRKPAINQWCHQTSTQIITTLLNVLNDGDRSNRTSLLPVDGTTSAPFKKGHNLQPSRLYRYTHEPSPISNPYFSAHIKIVTPHSTEEINIRLERFRFGQGAGLALVDPLQTPLKVAIGFFARSSPAMLLRHYITATNKALKAKDYPAVLLLWDSSISPPPSEWDSFASIKPASALVAYAAPDKVLQATAGVRYLYSDPSASPPLGRQMFFCPMTEFWTQPISFITQVLAQHYNSMMCENIVTEIKGLRPLQSPFPDPDSDSTLRDLLLSATEDPDDPNSSYLFTSLEQSNTQTRFLFYQEMADSAREFITNIDESVNRHFGITDPSKLYLPNFGPSSFDSSLSSDFNSLRHLFPTLVEAPTTGQITNSSGGPSPYLQSFLSGTSAGSSSRNQQRLESSAMTRRGR